MNVFKIFLIRSYQKVMYIASSFLNFKEPTLSVGQDSIKEVYKIIKKHNKTKPLVVSTEDIFNLGLLNPMLDSFKENNIEYAEYYKVVANPTVANVEDGLKIYLNNNCDCVIALGGGSAIDCAKAIAARSTNPKLSVRQMKGLLKIRHKLPLFIAIPTTAGTGSETTVASVIVDKENNDKYAINDPKLIPQYAFLDPNLLVGLPKGLTATTGMDALTHAVEAYIGKANTSKTKKYALEATKLIMDCLEKSVSNPKDIKLRESMLIASYKAGVAFTRAYVGNVHSIAHSLGGLYNVPHGLANSLLLPIVLRQYGKSAYKKLTELAKYVGLKGNDNKELAETFISKIDSMNLNMGVANTLKDIIKDKDIEFLVNHSYKESIPLYPTPRLLSKEEILNCIEELRR